MNHVPEYVHEFDRELTRAVRLLSERASMGVGQAEEVHEVFMKTLQLLLTALAAIDEKYRQLNGAPGNALTPVRRGEHGGFYRVYEAGAIYWHPSTGAHRVYGAIYQKYLQLGAQAGFLGYPTTDEEGAADGVGRYNHFQGGSIFWTPATKAWEVHGDIRSRWETIGWERSPLGYPTTDEISTPDGIGRVNHFQHGSIFWTPDTGAWEVYGAIRDKWASLGWEKSYLGYPMSGVTDWIDPVDQSPTKKVRFQRGSIITWTNVPNTSDIPDTLTLASGPLSTPAPVFGWVELIINSAGGFSYRGHFHNTGNVGLEIGVASAIHFQDADGHVLVASEEGHIGGQLSPWASEDHDFQKNGFERIIRDNWDVIHTRGMSTTLQVNPGVGDVVEAVLVTLPWVVGAIIGGIIVKSLVVDGAKLCTPHPHTCIDPVTGQENPCVGVPIVPSNEPCPEDVR